MMLKNLHVKYIFSYFKTITEESGKISHSSCYIILFWFLLGISLIILNIFLCFNSQLIYIFGYQTGTLLIHNIKMSV